MIEAKSVEDSANLPLRPSLVRQLGREQTGGDRELVDEKMYTDRQ